MEKNRLSEQQWTYTLNKAAAASSYEMAIVSALDTLIATIIQGQCPDLQLARLYQLIEQIAMNRKYWPLRHYLYEFIATLKLYEKDYEGALANIRQSLDYKQKPSRLAYEIRLLRLLGKQDEAAAKIERFKQFVSKDPRNYLVYNRFIEELEK